MTCAAVETLVTVCEAPIPGSAAIAAGNLTRADWGAAVSSVGNDADLAFRWGTGCDGVAVESAPLPRLAAAAGARWATARFGRVRSGRLGASEWTAESALTGESDVSAGAAQANPAPPVTTAAPIPSATARPPTRPTWADARITLILPTALQTPACRKKLGR